jgi:ParB/RepB/Spo0J family partition protein
MSPSSPKPFSGSARVAGLPRRSVFELRSEAVLSSPATIAIDSIEPSPRNPRQHMGDVGELADSLREHGLLQPIVVRRRDGGYQLLAGHRRLKAARQLGWTKIAAVVRDETDEQAYIMTLVENLQREDLQPKEEAAALEVLVRERGWSTRQVGEAIKRGPMYVSRRLRVFEDETLAPLVLTDQLAVSTAEELLVVADIDKRAELAQQAVDERWERPRFVRRCASVSLRYTSQRRAWRAVSASCARSSPVWGLAHSLSMLAASLCACSRLGELSPRRSAHSRPIAVSRWTKVDC